MKREIKFKYVYKLHGHVSGQNPPEYMYETHTLENIEKGLICPQFDYCGYYTIIDKLQFTGLLDKKGKEIYERDIVRMDSWHPTDWEILFIEGAFCLWRDSNNYANDIHYIQHAGIPQATVIGNTIEQAINILNNWLVEASEPKIKS